MEVDVELIKELYAYFGRTYYLSECLHKQLCNMYVLNSFKSEKDATTPRLEELLSYSFSLTLGRIVEEVKPFIPQMLNEQLEIALQTRNFLAHFYWYERSHLMFSEEGINNMIVELLEYGNMFSRLDEQLIELFIPKMNQFGLTEDVMLEHINKCKKGDELPPLQKKRRLNKKEKIIKAYDKPSSKGITLILQTQDGELWQLCDIGLGWCTWNHPEEDWRINKVIQEYLPVTINPRPQAKKSWCYQFELKDNVLLCFDRNNNGKLNWEIKKDKI